MNFFNKRLPIVVVAGATGTGKTKLSIEIAKKYNGEIVNADALQIYKGLDIATNKVTESEAQGIAHHLLGFKSINTIDFNVFDFQQLALEKINDIRSRNKMPIVVGGTNYYIDSILWPRLVPMTTTNSIDLDEKSNEELFELLAELDPLEATRLHPNNRRKVQRAIEIFIDSNVPKAQHLDRLRKSRRFPLNELVLLWISSDESTLFPRLDRRVEEMVAGGLLDELVDIYDRFIGAENRDAEIDYSVGIFQAIGLKEFDEFLSKRSSASEDERRELIEWGVEKLKTANKQYVKTQNKWLRNRFLRHRSDEEDVPLFRLDVTDVEKWRENVFDRAVEIIEQVRAVSTGQEAGDSYRDFVERLSIRPEPMSTAETFTPGNFSCEVCDNQLFLCEEQWRQHLASRRHHKRLRSLKKLRQREEIEN